MPRTFLAHLNLTLPDDAPAAEDRKYAHALMNELEGALAVGTDPEQTPLLARCAEVVIADAEEI